MQSHKKGQTDTNNDLQSTTQKITDWATRIPQKTVVNPFALKGLAVRTLYWIPKLH